MLGGVRITPTRKYQIPFDAMIATVQIAASRSLMPERPIIMTAVGQRKMPHSGKPPINGFAKYSAMAKNSPASESNSPQRTACAASDEKGLDAMFPVVAGLG